MSSDLWLNISIFNITIRLILLNTKEKKKKEIKCKISYIRFSSILSEDISTVSKTVLESSRKSQ